jgi:hypothetical protein
MITPIQYAIHRKGESPIFGEDTIKVSLQDNGAGHFITLESVNPSSYSTDDYPNMLVMDFKEIEELNDIVEIFKKVAG